MISKEEIRKVMLKKRLSMEEKEVDEKSEMIIEKLENMIEFKKSKVIMAYYPIRNEVDTRRILERYAEDKTILSPRTKREGIVPVKFKSLKELEKDIFGIPSPLGEEYKGEIDLILVPGLAFDFRLYRLGYGLGYYDRFLKSLRVIKIGLAYDFQILDELPHNDGDVKMDFVITEKRILKA